MGLTGPKNPYTGQHEKAPNWVLATVVEKDSPLFNDLADILADMPPFPGAGIDATKYTRPRKAKTMMLKEYCDNDACPYFASEGKRNQCYSTWGVIRKAGCHTCTACKEIMVVVLPHLKGNPDNGAQGGPIDPDNPPAIVDGTGSGKTEPLPDNVRITDNNPNRGNRKAKSSGEPAPASDDGEPSEFEHGADKPSDDEDDDKPNGEDEDDDKPNGEDEDGDFQPTDEDLEEDFQPTDEDLDGDYDEPTTGAPFEGERKASGGTPKGIAAHPADLDCTAGENGGPCPNCIRARDEQGL
jgi:hypothetical protein